MIFDMDGVISDSERLMVATEQEICRRNELAVPDSEWRSFKGKPNSEIFRYIVEVYGNDRRYDVADLSRQKRELYLERAARELDPISGALEYLNLARLRYRMLGLTTSNHGSCANLVLDRFKLRDFFDAIVVQEDIPDGRHKPNPDPYLLTAQRLGVAPHECYVVEDSDNGVMSAVLAGCTVIGLTTSFDRITLQAAGAHLIVDSFIELSQLA